jgi:hypothetical protein
VVDGETGAPLSEVQIFVAGPNWTGALTGPDGRYSVALVTEHIGQPLTVHFARMGRPMELRSLVVRPGSNSVDVAMKPREK